MGFSPEEPRSRETAMRFLYGMEAAAITVDDGTPEKAKGVSI